LTEGQTGRQSLAFGRTPKPAGKFYLPGCNHSANGGCLTGKLLFIVLLRNSIGED
jgi:hypothetical protein